jgi:hypothetical protein
MKLYLEAVAVALICIVPQLHDQRVELKSSKLAEMEKARWEGRTAIFEESDIMELEDILDLLVLGKDSERTIRAQSVFLDGAMQSRMDKVHQELLRYFLYSLYFFHDDWSNLARATA